jgi:hypothetical protein
MYLKPFNATPRLGWVNVAVGLRKGGLGMKKSLKLFLSAVLLFVIIVSAFAAIQSYNASMAQANAKKPFYVGVTYSGNSTVEAKALIDKVKNYTNLFVLQSGPLQENLTATTEVCDYAVDNGLNIIVYYGSYYSNRNVVSAFLNASGNRWGEHFLGLYYGDEPGGKMLDSQVDLYDEKTGEKAVTKDAYGGTSIDTANNTEINYSPTGRIAIFKSGFPESTGFQYSSTIYFPNGTIIFQTLGQGTLMYEPDGKVTLKDKNGAVSTVTDQGNISQFEPYQKLWDSRPLQSNDEAAARFESNQKFTLDWLRNQSSVKVFTSDYGLYWFDYLGGYDVVLAQFGWNHTTAQDIALVRGAASLQGKSWGAMITWKSQQAPYLASGEEMYSQMSLAYESDAQYVVVFNYSPDGSGVGLLQDEHFAALQRFWADVKQNSMQTHNDAKAEAALVLPKNYGWGMRNPKDTIWGLWQSDEKAPQVWATLQSSLAKYGSKLDIVYEDTKYSAAGHYQQIIYWNQTK